MPPGAAVQEIRQSLRAHPGFALAVLISLGLAGLIGLMVLLMQVVPGFLGMAHFREPHHRVHDLTYGLLFATAVVGLVAQLRRPSRNVAGMWMALMPWIGLLVAAVFSASAGVVLSAERVLVGGGTVTVALLHPARRELFRSFRASRVSWMMLALVVAAAVPLIAFAASNVGLQRTAADEHAVTGHYGFMAAFAFTVVGMGLIASLRPVGWRLTAWVTGSLAAALGLASLAYPDTASSLALPWALAAMAWGVLFIVTTELSRREEAPPLAPVGAETLPVTTTPERGGDTDMAKSPRYPDTSDDADVALGRGAKPGMPRWVKVSAIVVAVAAILLVVLMLTGVLGEHGPGQFGPGQHGP
jgi:hypothetical protein